MKRTLSTVLFTVASLLVVAQQPAKPLSPKLMPATAPTLTLDQKLTLKDFQLVDANLQVEIMNAEQRQRDNQQRAAQFMATVCKSDDGKAYTVKLPELTCLPVQK